MKTIVKALMIVMMMVIGTISAKATFNIYIDVQPDSKYEENTDMSLKKKCHICHIHTETCGGKYVHDRTRVYPGMNKRLRHHILKGHHKWHRDVCRKCHLTRKEVRKMEVEIRKMESEMQKSDAQKRQARIERHKTHKLERHNAKVEKHNAKVIKHNAKVERHNTHKLEKHNAKVERHNAKIEKHNAKVERRRTKKEAKK